MTAIDDRMRERLAADDAAEQRDEVRAAAADRVSFDLHFKRADKPRKFGRGELTGGEIDDAFAPPGQKSAGYWECPHFMDMEDVNENAWLQEFFAVAVTEAVHEALEWFRIDGKLMINPHGKNENAIMLETSVFARQLWRKYGKPEYQDVQGTCYGEDLSEA